MRLLGPDHAAQGRAGDGSDRHPREAAQRDGLTGDFKSHESLPAPLEATALLPRPLDLRASGDGSAGKKREGEADEGDGEGSTKSQNRNARNPAIGDALGKELQEFNQMNTDAHR